MSETPCPFCGQPEVTLSEALADPGKVDAIRHALGGGRLALEGGRR
jgi:hypothetical protein